MHACYVSQSVSAKLFPQFPVKYRDTTTKFCTLCCSNTDSNVWVCDIDQKLKSLGIQYACAVNNYSSNNALYACSRTASILQKASSSSIV